MCCLAKQVQPAPMLKPNYFFIFSILIQCAKKMAYIISYIELVFKTIDITAKRVPSRFSSYKPVSQQFGYRLRLEIGSKPTIIIKLCPPSDWLIPCHAFEAVSLEQDLVRNEIKVTFGDHAWHCMYHLNKQGARHWTLLHKISTRINVLLYFIVLESEEKVPRAVLVAARG